MIAASTFLVFANAVASPTQKIIERLFNIAFIIVFNNIPIKITNGGINLSCMITPIASPIPIIAKNITICIEACENF